MLTHLLPRAAPAFIFLFTFYNYIFHFTEDTYSIMIMDSSPLKVEFHINAGSFVCTVLVCTLRILHIFWSPWFSPYPHPLFYIWFSIYLFYNGGKTYWERTGILNELNWLTFYKLSSTPSIQWHSKIFLALLHWVERDSEDKTFLKTIYYPFNLKFPTLSRGRPPNLLICVTLPTINTVWI